MDKPDAEFLVDGELAPLVKGQIREVEIPDFHAEVYRYSCQDGLRRKMVTMSVGSTKMHANNEAE